MEIWVGVEKFISWIFVSRAWCFNRYKNIEYQNRTPVVDTVRSGRTLYFAKATKRDTHGRVEVSATDAQTGLKWTINKNIKKETFLILLLTNRNIYDIL